jgi:hypothetical protein
MNFLTSWRLLAPWSHLVSHTFFQYIVNEGRVMRNYFRITHLNKTRFYCAVGCRITFLCTAVWKCFRIIGPLCMTVWSVERRTRHFETALFHSGGKFHLLTEKQLSLNSWRVFTQLFSISYLLICLYTAYCTADIRLCARMPLHQPVPGSRWQLLHQSASTPL